MVKEVYNPKAVIPHAASLHQACAHCAIFPTAASRRSLGRISVPVWPDTLSGRLPVVALVGHHPTNKLIGRGPIPHRKSFPPHHMHGMVLSGIRPSFPSLSRSAGQITHVLLTRSPLEYPRKGLSVRLACVKHAASVRPEPGSNSPNKNPPPTGRKISNQKNLITAKQTPKLASKKPHPHKREKIRGHSQKNNNKNKTTKHTIEFSNNTRFRATLLLYSIAKVPSNCTIRHPRALGRSCVVPSGLLYSLYFGAETGQVLYEQRVAAIDVKNVVDLGVTVRDQSGQHQSRAGADVRRPHGRTR